MKFSTGTICFCFILIVGTPKMTEAFLEGFSQSVGLMNQQLTKFMEGLQESVDVWATKVIDNANGEECFYLCNKGQIPVPKDNFTYRSDGCTTFGIKVCIYHITKMI